MWPNPVFVKINTYIPFTAEKVAEKGGLLLCFQTIAQYAKIRPIWSPWLAFSEI
jgi:hypothetical protein